MAIVSMTGFGCGEAQANGIKAIVELGTVNRKQFDCNVSMPRELGCLEPKLHALIHSRIVRGYVKGTIALSAATGSGGSTNLFDVEKARAQVAVLRNAATELGLSDDLRASTLLRLPEMMRGSVLGDDPTVLWPLIEQAVQAALEKLAEMRQLEGAALETDLRQRFDALQHVSERIAPLAAEVPKAYQVLLEKRLAELLGSGKEGVVDPALLAREVAVFADRCDVSEELTRLASHFTQVTKTLDEGHACGRTLDFLCQELFREINTVGSKANDAEITRLVIAFKAGLEAAREQVQNIE
ncbi:MAG: YicC family protein [Kiritimatiellaeota bacterium]|nr:YicC family protein [Kiritimatiellota bacterium]